MFILNQERDKALYVDEKDINYLKVRDKSLNIMRDSEVYEETIGEYDTSDQAKAEMYRLVKCLSDGYKLFIVSDPKYLTNFKEN